MAQRNAKLKPRHIMTREQIDSMVDVKSMIPRTPSMAGIGGFQITTHLTYRYMTGIAPLVKCTYFGNFDGHHPRYINNPCDIDNLGTKNTDASSTGAVNFERIYDYGVAKIVTIPLYTVDPVSEIPGRLITGEITGMPIIRKITPLPTVRQSFPEHENAGTDYTRNDFNTIVDDSIDDGLARFSESPVGETDSDDSTEPWADDLTDGYKLSGDRNYKLVLPNSGFVFTDIVPTNILNRWDKLPGAVQRFWIGAVFLENNVGARHDVDRLSDEIGRLFHVSPRSVANCASSTQKSMKTPGKTLAGKFTVPDIKIGTDEPIDGDWDLKWDTEPRKPWDTLDGDRSYAEWGFDGPTDNAYAQRRAMLNNQ